MTKHKMNIAIAGLGTVGAGVVKLLQENHGLIAARCGRQIKITAVSARDPSKNRGVDLTGIDWVDDPAQLAQRADVDLVVEVMGGSEGAARALAEATLNAGKHFVTANKALIAHHGTLLATLAEEKNAALAFEAAVAGGIPILKALREGLAANRITRIAGILNGTCNYILTTMKETGRDFADVLAEAQKLGYAESDPSFDIDGVDTAHKLAILTALAFGVPVDIHGVTVAGIRDISAHDIRFADELGYKIKLLGVAVQDAGGIHQSVAPCLVPKDAPIATVDGVYNGIAVEGDAVGSMMFEGRGAGAGPTASAVVADIMDIARRVRAHPFGVPVSSLQVAGVAPGTQHSALPSASYYLRLTVLDKPGVLAAVTAIFRDANVSMRSFIQHSRTPDAPVQVVLTTHQTTATNMQAALDKITLLDTVLMKPQCLRIEV